MPQPNLLSRQWKISGSLPPNDFLRVSDQLNPWESVQIVNNSPVTVNLFYNRIAQGQADMSVLPYTLQTFWAGELKTLGISFTSSVPTNLLQGSVSLSLTNDLLDAAAISLQPQTAGVDIVPAPYPTAVSPSFTSQWFNVQQFKELLACHVFKPDVNGSYTVTYDFGFNDPAQSINPNLTVLAAVTFNYTGLLQNVVYEKLEHFGLNTAAGSLPNQLRIEGSWSGTTIQFGVYWALR